MQLMNDECVNKFCYDDGATDPYNTMCHCTCQIASKYVERFKHLVPKCDRWRIALIKNLYKK